MGVVSVLRTDLPLIERPLQFFRGSLRKGEKDFLLPQQLQPELDFARSSRTRDLAEERALHSQIGLSELGVIESIVKFSPKLKFEAFGDLSVFKQ